MCTKCKESSVSMLDGSGAEDTATYDGRVSFDKVITWLMIAFALSLAQPWLLGSLGAVKKGMSFRTTHCQQYVVVG